MSQCKKGKSLFSVFSPFRLLEKRSNKGGEYSSVCDVSYVSDVRRLCYKFVTFFHYLIFFICKRHCYKNIKKVNFFKLFIQIGNLYKNDTNVGIILMKF